MNTKRLAGFFRSLCAATLAAAFLPEPALAVSWQWSAVPQGGRERVTITLDTANQEANTSRDGTQSLRIALSPAGSTLTAPQTPPGQNALVQGVSMTDGALSLSLSAPSFGFIASRPAANRIVVEIYRDPLGARWQPDGRLAPPTAMAAPTTTAPIAAAAEATPPVTPATTTPNPDLTPVNPVTPATPPPPAALIPQNPIAEAPTTPAISTVPTTNPAAQEPPATAPAATPATTPAATPATATVNAPALTPESPTATPATTPAPTPTTTPAPTPATAPEATTPAPTPATAPEATPADIPSPPVTASPPPALVPPTEASSPVNPTASTPPPPQNTVLPTPTLRARLNTAGPDAWSENQILSPTNTNPTVSTPANTASARPNPTATAPSSTNPALPPRNRLTDLSKDTAPPLDLPAESSAPLAPLAQTPAAPEPATAPSSGSTALNAATPPPPAAMTTTPTPTAPTTPALAAPTTPTPTAPTTQVAGNGTNPSINITVNVEAPATPQASPSAAIPASTDTPTSAVTPPLAGQTTDQSTGQTAAPGANPLVTAPATAPASPADMPLAPSVTPLTPEPALPQANVDAPKNPDAPASPALQESPEPSVSPVVQEKNNPENPDDKADKTPDVKADENPEGKVEDKLEDNADEKDGEKAEAEPVILPIYVDEQGNPVPAPPDVPALLASTRNQMNRTLFAEALPDLNILKGAELSREERENVLYDIMKALFESSHTDLAPKAEEIHRAAQEAMNFNLDSTRVPEALNTLARVELAQNNLADAEGYVMLMKRRFPFNPQVASALLVLGEEQMQKQNYADATITFQTILQDYPESKVAKDAARMQTYSLYRQGHMQRALTLIDFVERRWPRLYLEDPNYLTMTADIETRQNLFFDALNTYWTLYNLNPKAPEVPSTLSKIGELYYTLNFPESGAKALNELLRAFPDSKEGPVALLRLGENGIHDGNPSLDEIFQIFDKVNPRLPGLYYQRIIQEYPDSPQVITAKIRLIAWQMWNKDTLDAMNAARAFMIDYEDKPESLRARDILLRGFAQEMGKALAEENFERVLTLWERFPQVHDYYQPLEPDLRVALARAQLNRGKEVEGMELLAPFLDGPQDPKYGQYVFNLYLASLLRQQNWDGLLSLGEKVATWALPKDTRDQLDYTLALSAENLGLQSRALPLWQKLAPKTDIPLFQRAYASYFLARDAERRQDLRAAYQYNLDALGMFTQLQDDQSPYADSERIRESIAALMDVTEIAGRFAESLDWANKYATFVPDTSPDYAGLRFREARLHRKMGDMARWRAILQGIIDKEADSVFGKMAASELHTQDVARDLTRFTGQ